MSQIPKAETQTKSMSWSLSASHAHLARALRKQMEEYVLAFVERGGANSVEVLWPPELEDQHVVIVVLLACYLEALINLYLSFKLDSSTFAKLGRMPPLEKWRKAPTRVVSGYSLSKTSELYKKLEAVFSRRNAVAHMRPHFSVRGKKVHQGNAIQFSAQDHPNLLSWMRLPAELLGHLREFDTSSEFGVVSITSEIDGLNVDWEKFIQRCEEFQASEKAAKGA